MTIRFLTLAASILATLTPSLSPAIAQELTGELRRWHPITLSFEGPPASEDGTPNPFRDYRLDVTFRHETTGTVLTVPGYFAADGQAAETGSTAGAIWRVHFTPDLEGTWRYVVSFLQGPDVASEGPAGGTRGSLDGVSGQFSIGPTDKSGRDHRGRGLLRLRSGRYLQFSDSTYFLKGGADSPENFLAYVDFDGTYSLVPTGTERSGEARTAPLHRYEPHRSDWRPGDPTWRDGRGKAIIGALNYLASEEMNSVYFLTMNVEGDGRDVWPWTAPDVRDRFDVSKLDQWNIVFDHMDHLGLMLHVLTQETENDQLLDGGELGTERRLYYRELVARFGHHLALTWNLGEENTNTDEQRKSFASYLREIDPYAHPIVVHTYPGSQDEVFTPLLGFRDLDGPSLQIGNLTDVHTETLKWILRSEEAGRPWFVSLDEIGPANVGVKPDGAGSNQDTVRYRGLWGNLMAGGAGVEWYFGYQYPHNDLNAEDWRSRDRMWDYTRHALTFFQTHLPFPRMRSADDITSRTDDYVLAAPDEIYVVYLPDAGSTELELPEGEYTVSWYNPRDGGMLSPGSIPEIPGGRVQTVGSPPADPDLDWVVLIRRNDAG